MASALTEATGGGGCYGGDAVHGYGDGSYGGGEAAAATRTTRCDAPECRRRVMADLYHLLRGPPPALRPAPLLPPLLRPRLPRPLPGAMAGVLPGRQEEGHLPHLQASLRRRASPDPPLLPVQRRVPDPGLPLLAGRIRGREQKAASLRRVLGEQRDGIKKLNAEVAQWREQATAAEAMWEAARKEKVCVQMLLNVKTEELSRKTTECGRL